MVIDDPYARLIAAVEQLMALVNEVIADCDEARMYCDYADAESGECRHDPGLAGDIELAISACDRELFLFELRHCWRTL